MSGIMAAVAGGTQNVVYRSGYLYNTSLGADPVPISSSSSSIGGTQVVLGYYWVGYYKPATTGTVSLTVTTAYTEFLTNYGVYNWGGNGNSISYLWLGSTAVSGYTTGNANAVSNNNTGTYSPSVVAGIYYPIRLLWQTTLPYDSQVFFGYDGYATGSFSLGYTGTLYYNQLSNGF
jgi:hypothetical protein